MGMAAILMTMLMMHATEDSTSRMMQYKEGRSTLIQRGRALLQRNPALRKQVIRALHDRKTRVALKQQLTILCDEGRSHPEYWALKTVLDKVDGGEDDSDVIHADGSFDEPSYAQDWDDDSWSDGFQGLHISQDDKFSDEGLGISFSDNDSIQNW